LFLLLLLLFVDDGLGGCFLALGGFRGIFQLLKLLIEQRDKPFRWNFPTRFFNKNE